ncbi:tripartite tricarboxylate transporter TctB family protein [Mesorhizobium sp. ASY16-5R]|uniref:tripartite tricarboxylate transporter TctB family protein n=1 Tax=Mesorhizobium sp. ASY16-5R TaxID=3445772 RepID=UPI003F9EBF04
MNNKELIGGLVIVAFAGAYALSASNLSLTSSLGIGAGLFPMILAGVLALLGAVVAVQALGGKRVTVPQDDQGPIPYRGIILVTLSPVTFALLIAPLGVVPALWVAVFLSALASRDTTLPGAAAVSTVMTVFCVGLFGWGLGLPLVLFGPFFPFAS